MYTPFEIAMIMKNCNTEEEVFKDQKCFELITKFSLRRRQYLFNQNL